jgi:putative oxidoreductase
MYTVIGRFTPQAFALLRIISGLMFALHGSQKLFGYPPSDQPMPSPLPPMVLAGGIIELACGILITIGALTGIAAFIASGEMAVAYFVGHAGKGGFTPLQNHGELAVLYCFIFLYVAAHGAGIWSVDSALRGRVPVTASTDARHV